MPRTEYFEIVAKIGAEPRAAHGFQLVRSTPIRAASIAACTASPARTPSSPTRPGCRVQRPGGRQSQRGRFASWRALRRGWKRETVAFGTATDPYQPYRGHLPADAPVPRGIPRLQDADWPHHQGTMVIPGQSTSSSSSRDGRRPPFASASRRSMKPCGRRQSRDANLRKSV